MPVAQELVAAWHARRDVNEMEPRRHFGRRSWKRNVRAGRGAKAPRAREALKLLVTNCDLVADFPATFRLPTGDSPATFRRLSSDLTGNFPATFSETVPFPYWATLGGTSEMATTLVWPYLIVLPMCLPRLHEHAVLSTHGRFGQNLTLCRHARSMRKRRRTTTQVHSLLTVSSARNRVQAAPAARSAARGKSSTQGGPRPTTAARVERRALRWSSRRNF